MNTLETGHSNELAAAFHRVSANHQKISYWQVFVGLFPILGYLVRSYLSTGSMANRAQYSKRLFIMYSQTEQSDTSQQRASLPPRIELATNLLRRRRLPSRAVADVPPPTEAKWLGKIF
jgi:hypothetical protein